MALLEIQAIASGYGEVQVLWDVSLNLEEGTLVTLLGSNGAGKTTLVRAATGLLPAWSGAARLGGEDVTRLAPHARAERGLTMVPEGRELFTGMTVEENLEMGAITKRGRAHKAENLDRVYELFPILKSRRKQQAGTMSGGEQQMLAIARGLMAAPRVLIIDELSLGLAPKLVSELFGVIAGLKDQGQTILLTEQNVRQALAVSDYAYVLAEGKISFHGGRDEVSGRDEVRRAYLGL